MSTGSVRPDDPGRATPRRATGAEEDVSLGERLGDVTQGLSTLVRQEVALAKAELKQTTSRAGRGVGLLVGAAVAGFLLLVFASLSLWWAIGNSTGRGWAALIVAGIWLVIAVVLGLAGRSALQHLHGLPETADTLGKIPNALKGHEEENR